MVSQGPSLFTRATTAAVLSISRSFTLYRGHRCCCSFYLKVLHSLQRPPPLLLFFLSQGPSLFTKATTTATVLSISRSFTLYRGHHCCYCSFYLKVPHSLHGPPPLLLFFLSQGPSLFTEASTAAVLSISRSLTLYRYRHHCCCSFYLKAFHSLQSPPLLLLFLFQGPSLFTKSTTAAVISISRSFALYTGHHCCYCSFYLKVLHSLQRSPLLLFFLSQGPSLFTETATAAAAPSPLPLSSPLLPPRWPSG